MKKMIKDILFISYLKNKGVRRICFIVGVLLAILPITIWYEGLSDNFYKEPTLQEKVARMQEIEYRGLLDKISPRQRAGWEEYKRRYNLTSKVRMPDGVIVQFDEGMDRSQIKRWIRERYPDTFQETEDRTIYNDIGLRKINYLYFLKLLWSFFWFYFPFLLSCIIKWVYTGFKEK